MMEFSFDTLVPGNGTVFRGRSKEEILAQVSTYAREKHGVPEVPDEIIDTIRVSIAQR